MITSVLFRRFGQTQVPRTFAFRPQSNAVNIEKIEAESLTEDLQALDEEAELKEAAIKQSQNKSNLKVQHQNIVNNKPSYKEAQHWVHSTLKYQSKVYGKYGAQSGFNPALCWNKEEIAKKKEYEAVAYPYSIQELIQKSQAKRFEKNQRIQLRQQEISQKMLKSEMWKEELFKKIAKKESDAMVAKERKDKLIEEVRRHFGYTVDPRDDRFKEVLEQKEKEQKKAMKEARKKAKQDGMVAKLSAKGKEAAAKIKEADDQSAEPEQIKQEKEIKAT